MGPPQRLGGHGLDESRIAEHPLEPAEAGGIGGVTQIGE